MNPEQACSACGSSLTPFEEARYFCKICKQHHCRSCGEWHDCQNV
jgi:hypothetical protein